jgi:hypothetical protein
LTNPPFSVGATRLLVLLNALVWLSFGVLAGVGAHPSYREPGLLRWAMAGFSLIAACILTAATGLLQRGNRFRYWLMVSLLAALMLATIMDEFGLADLTYLVMVALPLALLIKDRAWYTSRA